MGEYSAVASSNNSNEGSNGEDSSNMSNHTTNDEEEALAANTGTSSMDPIPRRRRKRNNYLCDGIACYLWMVVLSLLAALIFITYKYGDIIFSDINVSSNSNDMCSISSTTSGETTTTTKSTTTRTKSSDIKPTYSVTYDPSIGSNHWNPFNLIESDDAPLLSPNSLFGPDFDTTDDDEPVLGYIMQPDIVNGTAVFISDGDLYWTRVLDKKGKPILSSSIPAIRLTYTIGNVRTPKINPVYQYMIAFTATYQARREIYIIDLRNNKGGNRPVQRLTYVDSPYGVSAISGWKDDGKTLVYTAESDRVSLRDLRLYEIGLEQQDSNNNNNNTNTILQVLETRSIPLAQATEGTFTDECVYFVRYKQSSWTARYVGGTAESIWVYCHHESTAVQLTSDYKGTSKNPTIYSIDNNGQQYILFLSDRSPFDDSTTTTTTNPEVFNSGKWRATTMNLWAAPLPSSTSDIYSTKNFILNEGLVQLTRVSCQFHGISLQEYSIDPITGNIILRIGADLYILSASDVQSILTSTTTAETTTTTTIPVIPAPLKLPIQVISDYHEQQERLISVDVTNDFSSADVFDTNFDTTAMLLTLRGQVFVTPVIDDTDELINYEGAGQNIPARRYRVIPGSMTGGAIRVLAALHVPLYADAADENENRRLSLVLATDPLSTTAEHAFYMVEIQADHINQFINLNHLPTPFLGGHINGGSTAEGGLGSILAETLVISPCGRRFAWADRDDRICVMSMPIYMTNKTDDGSYGYQCLPKTNDMDEPLSGTLSSLSWSPGGRYLGVQHNALNQFNIISIVDCDDPMDSDTGDVTDINIIQISQVTPSRFNSYDMYWGKSTFDIFLYRTLLALSKTTNIPEPDDVATTLFFISDRDIISDVYSPWGSRAPQPHFPSLEGHVYALPLPTMDLDRESIMGPFPGGGTAELYAGVLDDYEDDLIAEAEAVAEDSRRSLKNFLKKKVLRLLRGRKLKEHEEWALRRALNDTEVPNTVVDDDTLNATTTVDMSDSSDNSTLSSSFPKDATITLPHKDLNFARRAYRVAQIPRGKYSTILSQTPDDGSLVLISRNDVGHSLEFFSASGFPSDAFEQKTSSYIGVWGLSTSRRYIYITSLSGKATAIRNTASGILGFLLDSGWTENQADVSDLAVSVWPALEYRQMYNDAWRLLRDYFYDPNLHNVDWKAVHAMYQPLVQRCGKREELDDVLGQMSSELSALHSFVYGGEYSSPDSPPLSPASLGAALRRSAEWKGYTVVEIPERDPDFNLIDGKAQYCPISDKALRPTGQKGLQVGDVIVAVNGESVMSVPHINMMLRGTQGKSIRLEVLRLKSGNNNNSTDTVPPESVIVVPISVTDADSLRYSAWEWKTQQLAKALAEKAGISVGYIHMRAMNRDGEDSFARGYFPDHDKDALIIDVRHNHGGNTDSWIIGALQRKAWSYWAGRGDERYGELDWNEQFAFRGKVIVLIDEHSSSNAEGVARGISELGIGKLLGTRTWGGGIWGSSSNTLVDGGIAAAPEWGVFNEKLGWGVGVEATGVNPDITVDNDPRQTFDGHDSQLEKAIKELKFMLKADPVKPYEIPGPRPDMSLHVDDCPV